MPGSAFPYHSLVLRYAGQGADYVLFHADRRADPVFLLAYRCTAPQSNP